MKLGMKNTLEHCICCNMTKQCLIKKGFLSIKLHTQLAHTSMTVQHSKKPVTENNNYEIRNEKYFGTLNLL